MQGITSLPGAQQQAPGQAAPFQAMPQQQPPTPQGMTGQLEKLPPQQLLAMFSNPNDKTPKWAVVSAYAKAIEQQRLMQAAQGQQAIQQGQMQAQQPPVAAQVMSQPMAAQVTSQPMAAPQSREQMLRQTIERALQEGDLAKASFLMDRLKELEMVEFQSQPNQQEKYRHGGMMHGYAGGGAVAFQSGGALLPRMPGETDEEYANRMASMPQQPGETDMQYQRRIYSAKSRQQDIAPLIEIVSDPRARMRQVEQAMPAVEMPAGRTYQRGIEEVLKTAPRVGAGAPRAGAGAPAAPAPTAPTGGIADLAGPNIDPYLLAARDAQRLMAEAAMRGAQPTAEQLAARKGLDALMGDIVTERQAEEKRRLAQAQKRIEEALERSKRAPLEDISYIGQMLEGMRGSKRFGEALAGAAAGAGRAQTARQEALRKAEERYDISRNDIATLAALRQQVQLDQAKAVEARASGDARSMQAAMLEVAKSKQQLAEFEAGLADKAEGRSLQRQQLALTASEGAADRALRERLAAAGAVPAEARFLEWLSSSPKNRKLYESVQEIKGEENRRLKLYEIYTKNKLSLGDMSFEDFLAGFKGAAGAGTAPPPGAVRVKGQ